MIFPDVAPAGTLVSMLVDVLAVTTAVVVLNKTALSAGVGPKLVPTRLTAVPIGPLVGENETSVGTGSGGPVPSLIAKTSYPPSAAST